MPKPVIRNSPFSRRIKGSWYVSLCQSYFMKYFKKFGGRGGPTTLRIRVSTHPHTLKIRGEGWSNYTAYPRIHSPTHFKNSGGGVVQLHCVSAYPRIRVSAYPLTHTLKKFGGRGGTTPLRIRVSTHPHTQKIRREGWYNSTAYPRIRIRRV